MKEDTVFSIFKASAGSGKTHQLTGEYLKLILESEKKFRNVLAVTFTNKATAEMRNRILQAISDLAKGKESDYEQEICDAYNIDKATLQKRAKNVLNQMLNQYSYFKISTIDSFFQQIIKSFTYELGLNTGFTLELDSRRVVDDAVVRLMDNYGSGESTEKEWIIESINEKIEKGNRWDVRDDIAEFSDKAFNVIEIDDKSDEIAGEETEKQAEEHAAKRLKELEEYKKWLKKGVDEQIGKIEKLGKQAVNQMKNFGIDPKETFYHKGSGAGVFFIKCSDCSKLKDGLYPSINSYVRKGIDEGVEGLAPKDKDNQQKIEAAGLDKILQEIAEIIDNNSSIIDTNSVILQNINQYALLYHVEKRQREICEEQNLFLLRSSMSFLNDMIGELDAPFIYEKVGYQINNFMIDEFQDTSNLNWKNFLPLIKNGIGSGNKSMIVGDVKQAIYRWRGGDWNLLDHSAQQDLTTTKSEIKNLEYNYRSCANVIKFNNWFFESVLDSYGNHADKMVENECFKPEFAEMFKRTYGEAYQKIPKHKEDTNGYVSIKYIGKNEFSNEEEYNAVAGEWLVNQVDELAELGYQPGDIAVLVRANKEGQNIAQHLAKAQIDSKHPERYRFMSNETILIGNNLAVRLLVAAMQFLTEPNKTPKKAQLLWIYFAYKYDIETASKKIETIDFENDTDIVWNLMPSRFSDMKESYKQLDMVQLCGQLIRIFCGLPHQISKTDLPFINEFEDQIQTFNEHNGSNLQQFMTDWDEKISAHPISMNDGQNAITITTIHKAKGLQYKAVILPYTNFDNTKTEIKWFKTDKEEHKKFSPLPISFKKELSNTIFKEQYYEELFMRDIDTLNILYVAFTRAVNDMRILTKKDERKDERKDKTDNYSVSYMLANVYSSAQELAKKYNVNYDEENSTISIGTPMPYKSEIEIINDEDVAKTETANNEAVVRIKCHSKDFFEGDEFDVQQHINRGRLYHHIFEYVKYTKDITEAVKTVIAEGMIDEKDETKYIAEIRQMVEKQADWFSHKWHVLTEQSVMLANGEIKRPDRILESDTEMVVIDYKFTSVHNKKYNAQVSEYVEALRQLTNKHISGYLWYVWPNEAVEVVK